MTDETMTGGGAGQETVAGGQDTMAAGQDTVAGGQDTLAGGQDSIPGGEVQPDWLPDWRDKLAAGDEKFAAKLKRFQSPVDVAKSYRALEQELSTLKASRPAELPENANEEQVAAYRKAAGIPEKPDGYLEKLPGGLVIGDDDKPMVTAFADAAHKANMPPAHVHAALDWYYRTQEAQAEATAKADKERARDTADALRAEWGDEYRANFAAAKSLLQAGPSEGDDAFDALVLGARLADGTLAGDNPRFLKFLVQMANDINPAGFVAPAGTGSQVKSVEDEIAEITGFMKSNPEAYYKDNAKQARLLKLYEAQERLAGKAA